MKAVHTRASRFVSIGLATVMVATLVAAPASAAPVTGTVALTPPPPPGTPFTVGVSPSNIDIVAGATVTATVVTTTLTGPPQRLRLGVLLHPPLVDQVTATVDPPTVMSGESATLTLRTPATVPASMFGGTVTAVGETGSWGGLFRMMITPPCAGRKGYLNIPDAPAPAVASAVTLPACDRTPSATSTVKVAIFHPHRGDLRIDLVAPDGTSRRLKRENARDHASGVHETYVVDLSCRPARGTWQLRIRDMFRRNAGDLAEWTLSLV